MASNNDKSSNISIDEENNGLMNYTRYNDDDNDNNGNNERIVSQQQQQQQSGIIPPSYHSTTSDDAATAAAAAAGQSTWSITDFGKVGDYSRDRSIHATDEVFNTASHVAATLLSILGTALLITQASDPTYSANGDVNPWKIVSFSIYGASLIFLFACSSLHHGISGSCEHVFRIMDYLAIYPLIAGTFTPLCLVYYHDRAIGWVFCSTVWGIAILGMIATAIWFTKIPKWLSMTMYITLGWFGGCMSYWLYQKLYFSGFLLFLFGGILYTIGGYVYSTEQPNPYPGVFGFHEIWHIAVILAAFTHWLMMYFYVLPYEG